MLFGRMLHAEQLHRAAGRRADHGHQHNGRPRRRRRVDQVRVPSEIHRRRGVAAQAAEAVDSGNHGIHSSHRAQQACWVTDVALDHFDPGRDRIARGSRMAGKNPDRQAPSRKALNQLGAKDTGSTGHEDHGLPFVAGCGSPAGFEAPTCRRTAESTLPPPSSTGSR